MVLKTKKTKQIIKVYRRTWKNASFHQTRGGEGQICIANDHVDPKEAPAKAFLPMEVQLCWNSFSDAKGKTSP